MLYSLIWTFVIFSIHSFYFIIFYSFMYFNDFLELLSENVSSAHRRLRKLWWRRLLRTYELTKIYWRVWKVCFLILWFVEYFEWFELTWEVNVFILYIGQRMAKVKIKCKYSGFIRKDNPFFWKTTKYCHSLKTESCMVCNCGFA